MRIALLGVLVFARLGRAQPLERVDVLFEVAFETTFGQSVFVLGDLPELGGNDLRCAVKLEPSAYPTWRATIGLPAGTEYTYRYYRRDDGPGETSSASNGTPIAPPVDATTPVGAPRSVTSKTVFLHSAGDGATLSWRHAGSGTLFEQITMQRFGDGRSDDETRWFAWGFGDGGREVEFSIQPDGAPRIPPTGVFTTKLDGIFVQDNEIFDIVPALSVGGARRDYSTSSPPGLFSVNLSEVRRYRVFLPRGYDEHPDRRYPVLYFHDGQNVFESGPFGSWNADDTLIDLTRRGRIREIIAVGVDNTANRFNDYIPPDDGGEADDYVRFIRDELKPIIDAQYRTMAGAEHTGTIGSSLGGLVSLYMGWDFASTFTRVGPMSGSWQFGAFRAGVSAQPSRDIRIYMDSGDCCGGSSDNYWGRYSLRDSLIGGASARYSIEGTLRHVVGFGQQHNEAAWSTRLPGALEFLFPPDEEVSPLLTSVFGAHWDVNDDGKMTIDDLYAQTKDGRDLDLDGDVDQADVDLLGGFLRRDEVGNSAGRMRQ